LWPAKKNLEEAEKQKVSQIIDGLEKTKNSVLASQILRVLKLQGISLEAEAKTETIKTEEELVNEKLPQITDLIAQIEKKEFEGDSAIKNDLNRLLRFQDRQNGGLEQLVAIDLKYLRDFDAYAARIEAKIKTLKDKSETTKTETKGEDLSKKLSQVEEMLGMFNGINISNTGDKEVFLTQAFERLLRFQARAKGEATFALTKQDKVFWDDLAGFKTKIEKLIASSKPQPEVKKEKTSAPQPPKAEAPKQTPIPPERLPKKSRSETIPLTGTVAELQHKLSVVREKIKNIEDSLANQTKIIDLDNEQVGTDEDAAVRRMRRARQPELNTLREQESALVAQIEKEGKKKEKASASIPIEFIPKATQRTLANIDGMLHGEYVRSELVKLGISEEEIDSWLKERTPLAGQEKAKASQAEAFDAAAYSEACAQKSIAKLRAELAGNPTEIQREILTFYIARAEKIDTLTKLIQNAEKFISLSFKVEQFRAEIAKHEAEIELEQNKRWTGTTENGQPNPTVEGVVVEEGTTRDQAAEIVEGIKNATSFEALYGILASHEKRNVEIEGTKQVYTGDELILLIESVRLGQLPIEYITRNAGLRGKVWELNGSKEVAEVQPEGQEANAINNEKEAEDTLKSARAEYIDQHLKYIKARKEKGLWSKVRNVLGLGVSAEHEAQLPAELQAAKEKYEDAKRELGQARYDAKAASLKDGVLWPEELDLIIEQMKYEKPNQTQKYWDKIREEKMTGKLTDAEEDMVLRNYRTYNIFKEVVLDEQGALQKAETETWTPKEKSVGRKVFENILTSKTVSMRLTRTAIVASIFAFPTVATGGLAAGAFFAGSRAVKSLSYLGLSQVLSKGYDMVSKDRSAERRQQRILELQKEFGRGGKNSKEAGKELQQAFEDERSERNRRALKKGIVLALAGAGTGFLGSHFFTGESATVLHDHAHTAESVPVPKEEIKIATLEKPYGTTPDWEEPITPDTSVTVGDLHIDTPTNENILPDVVPPSAPAVNLEQIDPNNLPAVKAATENILGNTGPAVVGSEAFDPDNLRLQVGPAGHDMWHIIGNYMEDEGDLKGLSDAARVHAIDSIYQKVVKMNPAQLKAIGIAAGNLNRMQDTEVVDLNGILTAENIKHAVATSQNLSESATRHIMHNVSTIEHFKHAHPHTPITERLVNRQIKMHPLVGKLYSHANH